VLGTKERNQFHVWCVCEGFDGGTPLRVQACVIGDQPDALALERRKFLDLQNVQANLDARGVAMLRRLCAFLRDEGLRRNYLNKVPVNRAIIAAWLADGAKRKRPKQPGEGLPPTGCEEALHDGSASCYLTGTYELREDAHTWLQIINPTGHDLLVYAYFFDANERPMGCLYTPMSANDLWEIPVNNLGLHADHGVAKIVSFAKPGEPKIGIVGNQRIWFRKQQGVSETGLHPIQSRIFTEDYNKMLKPLVDKCKDVKQ